MGNIKSHFPFDEVEEASGYLLGLHNGGGAKIRLISQVGNIKIAPSSATTTHQSAAEEHYDADVDIEADYDVDIEHN